MAKADDIEALLTLEIDGGSVTPEKFLRGVRAFFGLVNTITKQEVADGQRVRWKIQVKSGSNLVGMTPEPGAPGFMVESIARRVKAGIDTLEKSEEEPRDLPPSAIRHLRDLGNVVGTREDDDTQVRVWIRKAPAPVTHRSVARAAEFLGTHEDHGSIEGRLQTVTERGALQCVIYEPVWDAPVRCLIDDKALMDQALAYFGKRVEVYGVVRYRADGNPLNIKVEEIIPFPSPEDIPDFRAVRGALRTET